MYKESKFNKNYLNDNIKKSLLQKKNVNFWENVDKWRPPHLWRKVSNTWKLKKTIFE
jgi:hypothetical protein